MREPPLLVRDDADRDGHQRNPVQLAAAILPEIIARAAILLRVLIGNECVEDRHDLLAHFADVVEWDDEEKIVAPDVADESRRPAHALHDVMKDAGEHPDDSITLVVRIPVVEFLEMIEVGGTRGEIPAVLHTPVD